MDSQKEEFPSPREHEVDVCTGVEMTSRRILASHRFGEDGWRPVVRLRTWRRA
jgi:hypothetical protein